MLNKVSQFLSTLWQGGQYSYYWTAPNRASYWFPVDKIGSQVCPNGGQNVYFGVNPVLQIPSTNAKGEAKQPQAVRSQNKYIGAVNTLFGEFDFKDFGDTAAIRQHLKQFPFPSVAIFSGGGYHFYWLLNKTYLVNGDDDFERIRAIQANWVNFIGSDKQSKDLSRVLRVPGTRNYKEQYSPDFPTVEIVKEDYDLRYSLNHLDTLSRPEPTPTPAPLPIPRRAATTNDIDYYSNRALDAAAVMIRDAPNGEKHGTLLRAARLLGGYVAGGVVKQNVAEDVLQSEISRKADVNNVEQAYRTISNGLEYGKAYPITIEQKLSEREAWRLQQDQQNGQSQPVEPCVKRAGLWANKFEGYWAKTR